MKKLLFTSEAVGEGHPDKVADQISDAILDECLRQDSKSRVACEVFVSTGYVLIGGEIRTKGWIDFEKIARDTVRKIGYTDGDFGLNADSMAVIVTIGRQSDDIAMGVDDNKKKNKKTGAGDQGLMFGFACNETTQLMPAAHAWANDILKRAADLRRNNKNFSWLRPDSKCQITVEYKGDIITKIHTVVVSHQHDEYIKNKKITQTFIRQQIRKHIIEPVLKPTKLLRKDTIYHINPTGRFVIGGPHADAGLTGRKIIADTYGGMGRHGGGAFSGKDPSKVDRSAAYMARYIAKNVIAAKLATRCEVQLAYAIGVSEPVSVSVFTYGTNTVDEVKIEKAIKKIFPLTPDGINNKFKLRRPIFKETATYGHFGKSKYPWEKKDKVTILKTACK